MIFIKENSDVVPKKSIEQKLMNHPNHPHPLTLIHNTLDLYPDYDGGWKCDVCERSYNHQNKPYHCSICNFDLCESCFQPKKHLLHSRNHDLYFTRMETVYPQYGGQWKCDGCNMRKEPSSEKCGYHCFLDQFDLCSSCFNGRMFPVHIHPLKPANATLIYGSSEGLWICDECKHCGTDMRMENSWHCEQCQYDACKDCLLFPVNFPEHPHALKKADATESYPEFMGAWRCDVCLRNYQQDGGINKPYHCGLCQYDVCFDCIYGIDIILPPGIPPPQPPIHPPTPVPQLPPEEHQPLPEDVEQPNMQCVICVEQPKNATLVHGDTGHVCCCISCGNTLKERNIPCPICRAPIDHVIKHFLS